MRRKSDSVRARSMSVYIYRKRRLSHAKYVHVHSLRSSASTGHLVIVLATRESPEGPDRIVPCPGLWWSAWTRRPAPDPREGESPVYNTLEDRAPRARARGPVLPVIRTL